MPDNEFNGQTLGGTDGYSTGVKNPGDFAVLTDVTVTT